MTSLLNQEVQDIRIANLQKDVAFYTEAVSMLKRGWHRWLSHERRTIYPGDFELDREIRERVMKGELNPKALDYLYKINADGMTYAEALRRSHQHRRWQLVLGRTREQLRKAEEALQIATAERGY